MFKFLAEMDKGVEEEECRPAYKDMDRNTDFYVTLAIHHSMCLERERDLCAWRP